MNPKPGAANWNSYQVRYRYRGTAYHLTARRTPGADGATRLTIDGVDMPGTAIALVDDYRERLVEVRIPAAPR